MDKLKTDKPALKRFGLIMAAGFSLIAVLLLFKHRQGSWPALSISLFFLVASSFFPSILKYFYIFWMRLAFILGWVNTRLLLCIIFYLIFSPVGLIMRLFNRDPLERKFDSCAKSYWKIKDNKELSLTDYERRF